MTRAVLPERPALDGLRAVAVLAVFAFHAATTTGATGGFLGIDLFFVLSGFLITSLLLVEQDDAGRIDLRAFWTRRLRRLAPPLGVLLPVVLVVTAAWYGAEAYHRASVEAVGAFFYVINWQILAHGSDGGFAFPTALQHTWTIAVEAQFYLVWPVAIMVAAHLARARRHRRLAAVVLGMAAASAAAVSAVRLALADGTAAVTRAYYGSDLHSVPLLAGAALGASWSLWGPPRRRGSRLALEVAGLAGLAVVVLSTLAVRRDMAWLHRGGDLGFTVAAVALVAAAASPSRLVLTTALSWWPVRQLGRISYGVYLWHWPILLYLGPDRLGGLTGWPLLVAQLALTIGIAVLSARLLEIPVRRGAWPLAQRAAAAWLGPAVALGAIGVLLAMAAAMQQLVGPAGPLEDRPVPAAAVVWSLAVALGAGVWWVGRVRGWWVAIWRPGPAGGDAGDLAGDDDRAPASPGNDGRPGGGAPPVRGEREMGTPSGAGRRVRGVPIGAASVVTAAVAAPLVLLWPVTRQPTDRFAGVLDAPYSAWLGWRIAEAWRHGTILVTSIPDAVWPVGVNVLLLDGLLPAHVAAAANLLTGNVYLAYNLTLALGIGLDVWAAARLAGIFTDRVAIRVLSGLAFATLPALVGASHAHVSFTWAFTLPLLLRHAVLVARGDEDLPVVRVCLLLIAAYLCSVYHLLFGGLAALIVLLCWPDLRARVADRRRRLLARGAATVALVAVALSPFLVARVVRDGDERAAGAPTAARVAEAEALSADSYGIVTPQDDRPLAPTIWPQDDLGPLFLAGLRPSFPGFLVLAGAGLAAGMVGGPRARGRRALGWAAGSLFLLSLGPSLRFAGGFLVTDPAGVPRPWLPYRILLSMPGLHALRAPARVGYALGAVLVALAAWGLADLARRAGDGWWYRAVVATAAVLVACTVTAPMPSSDMALSPPLAAGLEVVAARARPGDATLVVPAGCRADDPQLIAWQTVHHAPSVGCNVSTAAIPWFSGLQAWTSSRGLAALRCDPVAADDTAPAPTAVDPGTLDRDAEGDLRQGLGVRFLFVDRRELAEARCARVVDSLRRLRGAEVIADDGTWQVLDLGAR